MTTSRQVYRPDPVQRPGRYPSAGRLERLERMVLGMHGVGSTFVGLYPNGIAVQGGSSIDLSKFCFGFKIVGAAVTITGGEVQIGTTIIPLPDWNCTIGEDYSFVGIEYDLTTAAYVGPSASVALFRSEPGKVRLWLHQFRFSDEKATLYRVGHIGNIEAPGNFA